MKLKPPPVEAFRDDFLQAIEARFQLEEATRPEKPWLERNSNWYRKGSAGKALGWLTEIMDANPGASAQAVIELLEARMDEERAAHPRMYTKRHFAEFADVLRSV